MEFSFQDIFNNYKLGTRLFQFGNIKNFESKFGAATVKNRVITLLTYYISSKQTTVTLGLNADLTIQGKSKALVIGAIQKYIPVLTQLLESELGIRYHMLAHESKGTLSLPYSSIQDIVDKTQDMQGKIRLMKKILDNINYNPDLGLLNTTYKMSNRVFTQQQAKWAKANNKETASNWREKWQKR